METELLHLYCDGGARGNPGPAAIGVVISVISQTGQSKPLAAFGKKIGETTNNVAEYQAVIAGLTFLKQRQERSKKIVVHLDSQLVAQQLSRKFKITKPHLKVLADQVFALSREVAEQIIFQPIPRAQNQQADLLVNQALDNL